MASPRHHAMLLEMLKKPGNGVCVDCRAKDPEWASISLGVFVCIECSGVHRNLGTHISKVRSLRLDIWTDETCKFMDDNGNNKANEVFEAHLPVFYRKPRKGDPNVLREQFIRAKYERKEFHAESTRSSPDASSFPSAPLKTGILIKKGKDGTKWAPRHVILRDRLTYSKREGDGKELGSIDVRGSKFMLAEGKTDKPFSIQILDCNEDRSYFFEAENGKDVFDWLQALRQAKALTIGIPAGTLPAEAERLLDCEMLLEGVLSKRKPQSKSTYQKRYFIMDRKVVYYFRENTSALPLGKIPLGGSQNGFRVDIPEADGNHFWLYTPHRDESGVARTYYLEAATSAERTTWVDALNAAIQSWGEGDAPDIAAIDLDKE